MHNNGLGYPIFGELIQTDTQYQNDSQEEKFIGKGIFELWGCAASFKMFLSPS